MMNRSAHVDENLIKRLKPVPILVAGDVMVDEYIIGDVERISPESPVPVLVARDRLRKLGGAGNVVRNLVTMGAKVALFAAVGLDNAGRWFKRHCEEMGIDTFWIKDDSSRPTTIKTRVVARNQQIVRIDEEQVNPINEELEKAVADDIRSVMPQVKAVVVSDYGKGFLTRNLLQVLLQEARDKKVPVLVDPKGMDYSRYKGATYITPNVREASMASGIDICSHESLVEAGRALINNVAAEGIVITRGKDGITLVTRKKYEDFPVKPVEIVDVTGAGDTVISTLALATASGLSIENAITLANLAASLVVARFGAASVTLTEMLESLRDQSLNNKKQSIEDIESTLRRHRMQGHKIVFTNGCFDLFHAGHLKTLRKAADLGDVLVVGVNSDKSVSRIKGPGRPVVPQTERVEMIAALAFVDYVVLFDEETPYNLIRAIRPDVLVKGEDWRGKKVVGEEIVKARGGRVEFVKLVGGLSTTEIINKIKSNHC
jgi:D-beta-D-heptose 7-phosphate kinase/D-beta-D-heptose 1-phosphate adenosyltransferase|uniref:Bifunctional protein HldE n=1 Tax=Desulfomonile tiedjei TaxID=2358 RepID=A0A7C4EW77_9BACT